MGTGNEDMAGRRDAIAAAIAAELQRQGVSSLDIESLVAVVEAAISGQGDVSEGRHPDELNATNDD
jgi:hypothetical protein